jgi:hypothetical protein
MSSEERRLYPAEYHDNRSGDPKTDNWTTKQDMPTAKGISWPRFRSNGKIYVIGGYGVNNANESAVEVYVR